METGRLKLVFYSLPDSVWGLKIKPPAELGLESVKNQALIISPQCLDPAIPEARTFQSIETICSIFYDIF